MKFISGLILVLLYFNEGFSQWTRSSGPYHVGFSSIDGVDNYIILGTNYEGLYFSDDYGKTVFENMVIQDLTTRLQVQVREVLVLGKRWYAVTNLGNLYYSDDDGASWIANDPPISASHLVKTSNKLFAGGYGLFYSYDSGNSWINLIEGTGISGRVVDFSVQSDSIVLVELLRDYIPPSTYIYYQKLRVSMDGGDVFHYINSAPFWINRIEMTDSILFGIGHYGPLYKSTNFGNDWLVDSSFGNIHSLQIIDKKMIFIGTHDDRIFFSSDIGQSWNDITGNFHGVATCFLKMGVNLYVGSLTTSVWKMNISHLPGMQYLNCKDSFYCYPNPTNGKFTIIIPEMFKNDSDLSLGIYDDMGRMLRYNLINSNVVIQSETVADIAPGIYNIVLRGRNGKCSSKIVVSQQ